MVLQKLSQTFKVTMALMLSVLSTGLLPVTSAYASDHGASGNNGTLKIHEKNTPSGTEPVPGVENNDPKVCVFNFEGFGFDVGQQGYIKIEGQGANRGSDYGDYSFGPTVASAEHTSYAETMYFNDENGPEIAEGLYKATLYGKDTGGNINLEDEKAKSKNFMVKCEADTSTPPVLKPCPTTFPVISSTDADANGWTLSSGAKYVDGGMKLTSTGDWNEATITRTLTGDLADLGTGINFTPDTQYLGLHIETSVGTLVYEKEPTYEGKWWSWQDFGVGPGMGYTTFGSLEDIVAANPGVTLENLTVLYTSPTAASTTVTSVKIGCVEYTFDKAPRVPTVCILTDNEFIQPWEYDEVTYPEAEDYEGSAGMVANNATYEFTNEGLHLSTPDVDSSVYGLIDAGNTPLQDVDTMTYKSFRKTESAGYQYTTPAYILAVDTNGTDVADGMAYFFYEPYSNMPPTVAENTWQTWDAIRGGEAKWWMSGTGQTLRTWDYFVEQFPEAVVVAYGFNQGTSNAETYSIVQDIEFDCAVTSFASPGRGSEEPEAPEVPVNNGNVLGDNTGKILASNTTTLPSTLPATGATFNPMLIIIASLAAYGAAYFAQGRRRVTDT